MRRLHLGPTPFSLPCSPQRQRSCVTVIVTGCQVTRYSLISYSHGDSAPALRRCRSELSRDLRNVASVAETDETLHFVSPVSCARCSHARSLLSARSHLSPRR